MMSYEAMRDRLADMTREARLSREATEKAVRRLERLRDGVAHLHDVYAVAPNEPRCCPDCAAKAVSNEPGRRQAGNQREGRRRGAGGGSGAGEREGGEGEGNGAERGGGEQRGAGGG